jgi:hypothetical protein
VFGPGVEIVDARVTLGDLSDPRLIDSLWASEKKQSSQRLPFYVHKVASPSITPDCPLWSDPAHREARRTPDCEPLAPRP